MLINLNFNSDKAIYLQIKEEIIKGIAKGDIEIDESLPSIRIMAEEIGVNLHTVSKAYNILKEEGYINIDRRKGAIINALPLKKTKDNENFIKTELEYISAQSYLMGIKKEEFLKICSEIYDKWEV